MYWFTSNVLAKKTRVCLFIAVVAACVAYSYSPAEGARPQQRVEKEAGLLFELNSEAASGLVMGPLSVQIKNVYGEVVQELEIDLASSGPRIHYHPSD